MPQRKAKVEEAGLSVQPFDLDAFGDPTGSSITIKGKTYYFTSDDDLSIDDRENLRRFSLRLREMEEWEPDEMTGMMTEQQKEQVAAMQIAMCQIALPNCPVSVLEVLKPIQRTKALDIFFTKEVGDLRWIDQTVWRWIQNRHLPPTPIRAISGTSITRPTGVSIVKNESATSDESLPSEASTEADTGSGNASTA
jgi:hypothetical protein